MMTKPENWQDLPDILLDRLLENVVLEYDHYGGSRDETICQIKQGNIYDESNSRSIQSAWNATSEETFLVWVADAIASTGRLLNKLRGCR